MIVQFDCTVEACVCGGGSGWVGRWAGSWGNFTPFAPLIGWPAAIGCNEELETTRTHPTSIPSIQTLDSDTLQIGGRHLCCGRLLFHDLYGFLNTTTCVRGVAGDWVVHVAILGRLRADLREALAECNGKTEKAGRPL